MSQCRLVDAVAKLRREVENSERHSNDVCVRWWRIVLAEEVAGRGVVASSVLTAADGEVVVFRENSKFEARSRCAKKTLVAQSHAKRTEYAVT